MFKLGSARVWDGVERGLVMSPKALVTFDSTAMVLHRSLESKISYSAR